MRCVCQQFFHAVPDFEADAVEAGADFLFGAGEAGGVVEGEVELAFAGRDDGAVGVGVGADCDDEVGPFDHFVIEHVGSLFADIDALPGHGSDGAGIEAVGFEAGGFDSAMRRESLCPAFGHLRAAGVSGADE